MAARKEFPVKVRRVAVTNKKTGVKYILSFFDPTADTS